MESAEILLKDRIESPSEATPETALLLADIELAHRGLEDSALSTTLLHHLERAVSTYGTIKHLLPKLRLTAHEDSLVKRQLERLRELIVKHRPGR